jgi:cell surface protein SprA
MKWLFWILFQQVLHFYGRAGYPSDNKNNAYNPELIQAGGGLLNPNIREIVTANSGFNVSEGQDYSKLENARKLNPNEYTFSPQLDIFLCNNAWLMMRF